MSYIQLQKVDINGVSQPYDIAVCGTASNFTPIGGIATALANKAEFYTGSLASEQNLPIGSVILVRMVKPNQFYFPPVNSSVAVGFHPNYPDQYVCFTDATVITPLVGDYKCIGLAATIDDLSDAILAHRVS